MQKGDILLVKYRYCPVGWLIRRITHNGWNHCALAIDENRLIEAQGKGVVITKLNHYLKKSYLYKIKLVRPTIVYPRDSKKVIDYAMTKIGRKYSYRKWLKTLWLIFRGHIGELPTITCSGLIAEAFSKVGFYFNDFTNPKQISPGDIDECYFTIVV